MSRTIGIIGLPNVGKSTIFNSLLNDPAAPPRAAVSNYPFCTIEPNIGIVHVPDERLVRLNQIIKGKAVQPTTIKFMDLAGLIKGSSHGEGLGNRFLASAREADAILHVVRCFEDNEIVHVEKDLNPERDMDIINIELCLADLEMVERRLEKLARLAKSGDKNASLEVVALEEIREALKEGKMIRDRKLSIPLFTLKPVIYLANIGEGDPNRSREMAERMTRKALAENALVFKIAGKLENELKNFSEEEREEFREELVGEKQSPLERLIQLCYQTLDLITFYTTYREKLSAWALKRGENIVQAARCVHSDMEHGFIKAEVINFKEFIEYNLAGEKGYFKIVGRDYLIQDGDIIYIHFATR